MGMKSNIGERSPESFTPLTMPVFHILLTLAGGEAHGYAIMKDVLERSGGSVRLGPGTLYGAISRLLEDGLIEEFEKSASSGKDDPRRRYYRLTKLGGRVLAEETKRLETLVRAAKSTKVIRKLKPA
jgi:DNA-binding PadR family transcriptional regulator